MKTLFVTAAALVIVAAISGAQAPVRDQARVSSSGSASVSGFVLADDATRAPLRRATVTLSRANVEDIRTSATDDEGRYLFANLPAGSYTLTASKGAYISMSYGAAKAGMPGGPITLTDGQAFVAQPIALMRGAVIAGRLLDRTGKPLALNSVQAFQIVTLNGERRRRSGSGTSGSAITNVHGDYRISGLLPGEYLVSSSPSPMSVQEEMTPAELAWSSRPDSAAPAPSRSFVYAPTMYPGTADAGAGVVITLGRSEERLGVDFSIQPVPVARVSGKLTGLDGKPPSVSLVFCTLKDPNQLLAPSGLPISRPGPDGVFACPGLAPGQYIIGARVVPATSAIALWGFVEATVSGRDITDLALQLQPGLTVSGQIVLKPTGASPPPDLSRMQIRLAPLNANLPLGSAATAVGADGAFQVPGIVPGAYRLITTIGLGAPGNWAVSSALLSGKDVADVPFEIGQSMSGLSVTLTDAQTELQGTLLAGAGQSAPQVYVFVFPADKAFWTSSAPANASRRVQSVRSNGNGTYRIAGLPPGEYYLCALTEFETALQYEPGYLEQLVPFASKITLGEGEKKRQDLRIGG